MIVVYDITNIESFDNITKWMEDIATVCFSEAAIYNDVLFFLELGSSSSATFGVGK